VTPTDAGSITNIITSALGIGAHDTPDTTSVDHSHDQTSHVSLLDSLIPQHHHGLFG
jgi:hypothetical protein